ncbi:MAG: hypothetical protein REI11_11700 [Patulibacter sp.]|nr:hypothetical protein [Patulibacter sp.]
MSEIMVARRSCVLKTNDGTKYRLKGGETLADAAHPAVVDRPESWRPVEIHLPAEADIPTEGSVVLGGEDRLQVADDLDAYATLLESLAGLVDSLEAKGYPPPPEAERGPGWFAAYVQRVVSTAEVCSTATASTPDDVPPPPRPAARKAASRKSTGG